MKLFYHVVSFWGRCSGHYRAGRLRPPTDQLPLCCAGMICSGSDPSGKSLSTKPSLTREVTLVLADAETGAVLEQHGRLRHAPAA